MSYPANFGPPKKRYVNRLEMLEQQAARQRLFEVALEASKPVEAMPAPSICHFEPLWQVCADAAACELWRECLRLVTRARAIQAARVQVLISRAGL